MPGGRPRAFDADEVLDAAIECSGATATRAHHCRSSLPRWALTRPACTQRSDRNRICFIGRWPAMRDRYGLRACARSTNRQLGTSSEPCFATTLRRSLDSISRRDASPFRAGVSCGPSNAAVDEVSRNQQLAGEQALADRLARAVRDGEHLLCCGPCRPRSIVMTFTKVKPSMLPLASPRNQLRQSADIALAVVDHAIR